MWPMGHCLMIIFYSMSKKFWHLDSIYCKAMLDPVFGQSLRQTDRVITIPLELQISGGCFYISQCNQFLRNLHTVLCSGCIRLHSHQQHKSVPFPTGPLQHLLFVDFLMTDILTSVRWYLMVILMCISLILSGVEHLHVFGGRLCVFFGEMSV